jgi:hypothetical protein
LGAFWRLGKFRLLRLLLTGLILAIRSGIGPAVLLSGGAQPSKQLGIKWGRPQNCKSKYHK